MMGCKACSETKVVSLPAVSLSIFLSGVAVIPVNPAHAGETILGDLGNAHRMSGISQ